MKIETSRRDAHPAQITVWRATVSAVADAPDGGQYVAYLDCKHDHSTPGQAEKCAVRLSRYVERHAQCPEWAEDNGQIAMLAAIAS